MNIIFALEDYFWRKMQIDSALLFVLSIYSISVLNKISQLRFSVFSSKSLNFLIPQQWESQQSLYFYSKCEFQHKIVAPGQRFAFHLKCMIMLCAALVISAHWLQRCLVIPIIPISVGFGAGVEPSLKSEIKRTVGFTVYQCIL